MKWRKAGFAQVLKVLVGERFKLIVERRRAL